MTQAGEPKRHNQEIEGRAVTTEQDWPEPENDPRKIDYRQLGAAPAFIENARKKRRLINFLRGGAGFAGGATVKALDAMRRCSYYGATISLMGYFVLLGSNDVMWLTIQERASMERWRDVALLCLGLSLVAFNVSAFLRGRIRWLKMQVLWLLTNFVVCGVIIRGGADVFDSAGRLDFQHLGSLLLVGIAALLGLGVFAGNATFFEHEERDFGARHYQPPLGSYNAPPAAAPVAPPKDVLD